LFFILSLETTNSSRLLCGDRPLCGHLVLYLSDRSAVPHSELTAVRLRLSELAKHPSIVARWEFPYLLEHSV
jgi:hypothetical protein